MPTVVLRPSSEISSGNFSDEAASGSFSHAKINDSDNSTYVFNSSGNQSFAVHLDDTSGLSGATFNNFVVTAIFQKHGGRGADGTFRVDIGDGSSVHTFGAINDTVFDTSNTSATTISATAINFGGSVSDSDVDDMRLSVTTTDNTQVRFFELFVTIDYTAAASATVHSVNTVAEANIATIKGVAHANIAEINTVTFD
tara:strand:+ start:117 stop:710 length:594 start_codon:yes stop_codon:yes gene_type:complete